MWVLVAIVFAIDFTIRVWKSCFRSFMIIGVVIVVFEYHKGTGDSEVADIQPASWTVTSLEKVRHRLL